MISANEKTSKLAALSAEIGVTQIWIAFEFMWGRGGGRKGRHTQRTVIFIH